MVRDLSELKIGDPVVHINHGIGRYMGLMSMDLGEGDETDEEDWASIGAEALRARSLGKSPRLPSAGGRIYQPIGSYSVAPRQRSRTPGYLARSAPVRHMPIHAQPKGHSLRPDAGVNSSSERAAIEALLSMGSM